MAKYRIRFTKRGDMKYVSHLDLIRLFTRMFHRAQLTLLYSQGYNPHPKLSVLLPLSVGIESDCEYLDAEFSDDTSMLTVLKKLKSAAPLGMDIPEICAVNETSPKAKELRWASYDITTDCAITAEMTETFLERESAEVLKKTKRSEEMTDILPDVLDLAPKDTYTFSAVISAGSAANLKPAVLLEAMERYIPNFTPKNVQILRTGILTERGEKMM